MTDVSHDAEHPNQIQFLLLPFLALSNSILIRVLPNYENKYVTSEFHVHLLLVD